MSVHTKNGYARSTRSKKEEEELIEQAVSNMSKDELEVLKVMLEGISNPQQDVGRKLLSHISSLDYVRTPVDMRTFVHDEYFLGNTCDSLYPRLLDDLVDLFEGRYSEAIFTGAIGWGKCLEGSTRIYDDTTGCRVPIRDLVGRTPSVVSLLSPEGSVIHTESSRVWDSGFKRCVELTLASGSSLRASYDHPVLTPSGYLRVVALRPGDLVACPRSLPEPQYSSYFTDDEVEMCAVLLDVGSSSDREDLGNREPFFVGLFDSEDRVIDRSGSLKDRIPADLFGMPNRQVALFIKRLFSFAEWLEGDAPSVSLYVGSDTLRLDIQYLLRGFGVGSEHCGAFLKIRDPADMLAFLRLYEETPRTEKLTRLATKALDDPSLDCEVVPISRRELKAIRAQYPDMPEDLWQRLTPLRPEGYMGRRAFQALCDALSYRGKYWHYVRMDVTWSRVVSLEDRGRRKVYDLTVPETANVEANGMFVHNTFTASIGVCRCLYELSCLRDPQRSFGLASNSNISLVCLSVNEDLAMKVAYENIAGKIEASPYFQEHYPFQKTKKELRFPGKVIVAARATTDNSVLGLNVIGGLLDECLMPGTKVLMWDGSEVPIEDLEGRSDVVIETFDFEKEMPVPALAHVKPSTLQECYELELDNGMVLRGSTDHPIAIQTADGRLVYNFMGDVALGQEVVVYGEVDRREKGRSFEADEGALERRGVRNAHAKSRGGGEAAASGETNARRGKRVRDPSNARSLESFLRENAYTRAEEAIKRASDREDSLRRRQEAYVRAKEGTPYPLVGVQGGSFREKQEAQGSFQAYGGGEAAYIGKERVEPTSGGLSLFGVGRDYESGSCWLSKPVRITSRRAVGAGQVSSTVRIREVGSTLLVEREHPPHIAGFPYMGVRGPGYRSETSRLHLPFQREGQDSGRSDFLRGARLGIRGLGRVLSVARVVSKKNLGVQPTYDLSAPGYETYVAQGVVVHNSNFLRKKKSSDPRFNLEDHAQVLYNAMMRRMKSRFGRKGVLPGTLFVVSSKQTHDDFTAKRVHESADDPGVFVRDYALWDVKPDIYYSGDWFHVVVGNEQSPSRILSIDEDPVEIEAQLTEGCLIIRVPEDYRDDFERDLEGSIRDLAGCATVSVSPFIQRREKIVEAIDTSRGHPFTAEVYDPTSGGSFKWAQLVRSETAADLGLGHVTTSYKPLVNPGTPRHIHIDPSLTGDATGICMGHVAGFKEVVRRDEEGFKHLERAPLIYIDFVLRIVPPVGDEIMIGDVRRFVYQLSRHGYMITLVTMDSWQSAEAIQKLNSKGFNAEVLSVDKSIVPYEHLKSALYENRLSVYDYPALIKELRELEMDRARRKIDHPSRGSKDISDALAGVCHTLTEKSSHLPMGLLGGQPVSADAWMDEHQHRSLAQSYGEGAEMELSESEADYHGTLPPFIFGSDGDSGGW